MTLTTVVVLILIVALVLWVVSMLSMDARAKTVLYVVIGIILIVFLLSKLGGFRL